MCTGLTSRVVGVTHSAEVKEEVMAVRRLEPLAAAAGRTLEHELQAAARERALQWQL